MSNQNGFVDVKHVGRTLELFGNGGVIEVRALKCQQGRAKIPVVSGVFDDVKKATAAVVDLEKKYRPAGVYIVMNTLDPACLARSNNRLREGPEVTASDADIEWLRWLLVDLDPVRKRGVSATKREKKAADKLASKLVGWFKEQGWPKPIHADSGNGVHLACPIDLDNTAENTNLLKAVLAALDRRFSTERVKVDTTTYNPSRICKLWGTTARKGESTQDRPHRLSRLLSPARRRNPVPREKLEAVAGLAGTARASATNNSSTGHRLDVARWLGGQGVEFTTKVEKGRVKYLLKVRPIHPDHGGTPPAIFQDDDGKLGAKCFHDRASSTTSICSPPIWMPT